MKIKRHKTRKIKIGNNLFIGGNAPVVIESMTNADVYSVSKIIKQINQLADAGCHLVRISLPDIKSAQLVSRIKEKILVRLNMVNMILSMEYMSCIRRFNK